MDSGKPRRETRWRVHTLPRSDGTALLLFLVSPSTDPEVVAAVEQAAAQADMTITRVEDDDG